MVWVTKGIDEGMGEWMKAQAMVLAWAAIDEGMRAHETWPRA